MRQMRYAIALLLLTSCQSFATRSGTKRLRLRIERLENKVMELEDSFQFIRCIDEDR